MIPRLFRRLMSMILCCSLIFPVRPATIPRRQIPADPTGVITISSPGGVQIRYKEPGICETTPEVKSYSGYVDLDAETHIFFWFFEARQNPSEAPITLWLTGGPGDDSLLATFLGECVSCSYSIVLKRLIIQRERPM
jgi:hypothetical protein